MTQEKKDWTREELEEHTVGKMTAVPIPVNITMIGTQRILNFGELEDILRSATTISQEECGCRKRVGNCIDPMDGCLGINDLANELIEKGEAKQITLEKALEAMNRTYDAGLVHMAYTFEGKDEIEYICSCCSCCCHSLSAALRFGYKNHVFSSKYVANQDGDKCASCGTCVDRCQFKARTLTDDNLEFIQEKCFGCGLCIDTCPEEAISLVDRS
ncbi:MAG: 4Fe-4S binding protein [Methanobacteriota archaeon]|nr:MAG: 4Fe-4S binding protein [Euryarchaeota archaeon]